MLSKKWKKGGFRFRLFRAQDGKCCYCNEPMRVLPTHKYHGKAHPNDMATREHIKPVSQGGTGHIHNIALACHACNGERDVTPWILFKSYKLGEITKAEMLELAQ